jgi:uncharacterized tellurite resistance protein B-like protein
MENLNTEIIFENEVEAAFTVLYAVIGIDGSIDKFEVEALVQAITLKKTFRIDTSGYFEKAKNLIDTYGSEAAVAGAATMLSDELKKAVFVIALDLVYANDTLDEAEQRFMNSLVSTFNLSQDWAKTATDVISLKYV